MEKNLKKQINQLTQEPGVYFFKDKNGEILDIGKAANLKKRVRSHFVKNSPNFFKNVLIKKITEIDHIQTQNEKQAFLLENQLIKKYQPRFNIQWRDDKSYFWVNFSQEEWPKVKITHRPYKIASQETENIGPFINGRELKQTLSHLRKILPFRTCKNSYEKPCLSWHLGLCCAHKNHKGENHLFRFKNFTPLLYKQLLATLKQILLLYANEKIKIEAYDISNIQGDCAVGSMVVFFGNRPQKSAYRRFRIRTIRGANDAAMINEVLKRRLRHSDWLFPDLILIDGGPVQLKAAQLSYRQWQKANFNSSSNSVLPPPMIALAKKKEEIFSLFSKKSLQLNLLPLDLKLIFQAIRDEAHRFAVTYFRKIQKRKTLT